MFLILLCIFSCLIISFLMSFFYLLWLYLFPGKITLLPISYSAKTAAKMLMVKVELWQTGTRDRLNNDQNHKAIKWCKPAGLFDPNVQVSSSLFFLPFQHYCSGISNTEFNIRDTPLSKLTEICYTSEQIGASFLLMKETDILMRALNW